MLAHGRPMRCCYSRNVGLGDLNSSRICTTPRDTILSYGRALRLLFGDVQDKLRAVRKTLADFDLATKLIGSGKSWQAGEKALHPGAQVPLKGREIPHASLQTPRPHRTYVWPAQRLATRLNPRRPMPQGLPVNNRPRSSSHILGMRCCNGACVAHSLLLLARTGARCRPSRIGSTWRTAG